MFVFETVFDILYLIAVISIGIKMVLRAKEKQYKLFGIMAILLGFGDAFHLVPRIYSMWGIGFEANVAALGIGQMITSITMTIFYIMLYFFWKSKYKVRETKNLTLLLSVLGFLRIALCFAPQNAWTSPNAPLTWGIYRNIPFAIIGIIIAVIFYKQVKVNKNDKSFKYMWLAIALSFAFYAPVVLFADIFPPIGALMLPKTLAYVWIVWMGYSDMKKGDL